MVIGMTFHHLLILSARAKGFLRRKHFNDSNDEDGELHYLEKLKGAKVAPEHHVSLRRKKTNDDDKHDPQ
jgi:hypothetical protein